MGDPFSILKLWTTVSLVHSSMHHSHLSRKGQQNTHIRYFFTWHVVLHQDERLPNYIAGAVQGIIQHATVNNLAFGRSVDETIRTLQAIQYVQENPDERPTIAQIVSCLSNPSIELPSPREPAFFMHSRDNYASETAKQSYLDQSSGNSYSLNEMSKSGILPR